MMDAAVSDVAVVRAHDVRMSARWFRAAALILLGVVAAWSWLFLVSRWGPAARIDILTFKAGLTSKVMRSLLKPAEPMGGHAAHNHDSAAISGIYGTPEYYAMTEQTSEAARYQADRFAVFYLFEDVHMGELPATPPHASLRVNGSEAVAPVDSTVVRASPHHRVSVVRFARDQGSRAALIGDGASSIELMIHDMSTHSQQIMRWDLPIVYPTNLHESDLSLPTLFALLAGLLAVLSPCLLQLTVYYTFAVAGISMQPRRALDAAVARGHVVRTALWFIAGFTTVFTLIGALAGVAGQRLESSGVLEHWSRPLGILAGVGILLLGVTVAVNSDASGICRLPSLLSRPMSSGRLDALKMMFMGSAFAVGCSTCFGGALFMSLMIYVGTVGSASLGALALFLFSVGMAVPYVLSALFLSRALPILNSLQRVASGVGLVSASVMIFFGVILITDNFHIPSNLLYRLYLGL
jgi:cytochrome c-type biogenesis protein